MRSRELLRVAVALTAITVVALPSATASASEPTIRDGVLSAPGSVLPTPSRDADTSAAGLITFDTGTAPCSFDGTQSLRDQYDDLGVHFRARLPKGGGAVLNECGGFGIDARSGEEFLAFNESTYAQPPQHIRFDDPQQSVELYVANGDVSPAKFLLKGRSGGVDVAVKVIKVESAGWTALSVTSDVGKGMDRVIFKAKRSDGAFVVDDLTFTGL